MAKRLKMVLYGEPGVGKSVFACKAPKPFFITTDGNYEWLEDFGAKEEDHIQVSSWSEAKKAFKSDFKDHETIVIDLIEDLFKWCEYEFCKRNNLDHISDIGFAKGYDSTRTEFFIEMCKLIGLDKNIIFITHGMTSVVKDRRGVEHTHYSPSSRIPDKVWDMIEGRVRYFLRCYCKAETLPNGKIVKKRYLSLIPKENEFGIHRGVNENDMPQDIELDFDLFASFIGLDTNVKEDTSIEQTKEENQESEQPRQKRKYTRHQVVQEDVKEEPTEDRYEQVKIDDVVEEQQVEEVKEEPVQEQPKEEPVQEEKKELTQKERIEAIKAKLAARKIGG